MSRNEFDVKLDKKNAKVSQNNLIRRPSFINRLNSNEPEHEKDHMDMIEFEDVPLSSPSLSSSSLTLDKIGQQQQTNSKPIEFLELYIEDLGFNLKLLHHEITLIQIVFYNSIETQVQLVSELKVFFIDILHKEFEKFFEVKLDFSKMSNCDDSVIIMVMLMLTRIYRVKEKLNVDGQHEDMTSTTKLLQFCMRTSEICSPLFLNYLETIRVVSDETTITTWPANFGTHPYIIKLCTILRMICQNEVALADAIRIGFINSKIELKEVVFLL